MKWHFADIWEVIADVIPENEALVYGQTRRSWQEYENRAARLAQVFTDQGLGPDAKVAIFACNCSEYLEAQFGLFKARCVPVNINYRYLETELVYLLDNSDSEALVFQARFADKVAAIRDQLPGVRFFLEIDDGSGKHLDGAIDFEEAIASTKPMPRIERSEDDIYMLYTGGTTGMPKGVMYRQGEFAPAILAGYAGRGIEPPTNEEELVAAVRQLQETGAAPRSMPACPLMHGSGMWLGAIAAHHLGGTVITFDNNSFDPAAFLALIDAEKVTDTVIVGDSFGKPILKVLDAAKADNKPCDLSSLVYLISSGAMCSLEVKRRLLEYGSFIIVDAIGSSEGNMGAAIMNRDTPENETAKFTPNPTTKVFTEDWREVQPGSGEIGLIANGGFTPVGYYKDPVKSAETFREINGHRYSIPGDYATIEADGTLTLLGRGSVSINTGGEKVFPEEVEEAIKTHPSVYDCLVVGVPDERFGERITAVTSFQNDEQVEDADLIDWVRGQLAGYKLPKTIVAVPVVERAANGKPNYKWAKETAIERCASSPP